MFQRGEGSGLFLFCACLIFFFWCCCRFSLFPSSLTVTSLSLHSRVERGGTVLRMRMPPHRPPWSRCAGGHDCAARESGCVCVCVGVGVCPLRLSLLSVFIFLPLPLAHAMHVCCSLCPCRCGVHAALQCQLLPGHRGFVAALGHRDVMGSSGTPRAGAWRRGGEEGGRAGLLHAWN